MGLNDEVLESGTTSGWRRPTEGAVSSLELWTEELRSQLTCPVAERDLSWAYHVCTLTRQIHMGVWEWRPSHEVVSNDVMPLLDQARQAVSAVRVAVDHEKKISGFSRNIADRIANLERYVRNVSSASRREELIA